MEILVILCIECMTMNKFILVSMLMFLASCATVDSKEIYLQSGKKGHAITCSAKQMDDCHYEAGAKCKGAGYNIFNRKQDRDNIIMTISCREE